MLRRSWGIGIVIILASLVACSVRSGVSDSPLEWPVSPEPLPDATSATGGATLTCGGRAFPAAGLEAPTGAEVASGPEFDALRAALAMFAGSFAGSSTWTWRLAGRDDSGAIFLASTGATESAWAAIEVASGNDRWSPLNMGDCSPHVVLSADYGPASWALDPAFAPPTAGTTELHILVWERACSGGSPSTGRMSAPVVQYSADAVTVTLGVRPLQAAPGSGLSCPMPQGTPASLRLAEPLGDRILLDGGAVPPVPPSPSNG